MSPPEGMKLARLLAGLAKRISPHFHRLIDFAL